jgi:hypothetical protein
VIELIAKAWREFRYGASWTRLWLMRVHEVKVATKTITSICSELGLRPIHPPRRHRGARQLKLSERPHFGDSRWSALAPGRVHARRAATTLPVLGSRLRST